MKRTTRKKSGSSVESALIKGLEDALSFERGRKKLAARTKELPKPAPEFSSKQIKAIRKSIFEMSQPEFAVVLNISPATLRSWEQGTRRPSDSAHRLLQVLRESPQIVKKIGRAG